MYRFQPHVLLYISWCETGEEGGRERGRERGREKEREKMNKWEREREKELVREYKSSANVAYLLYSIKILANGPTPLQYVLWCYGR